MGDFKIIEGREGEKCLYNKLIQPLADMKGSEDCWLSEAQFLHKRRGNDREKYKCCMTGRKWVWRDLLKALLFL